MLLSVMSAGRLLDSSFIDVQMGVKTVFLASADEQAHMAWTSESLGFNTISEGEFQRLCVKHTLVENGEVYSRCTKDVPDRASLMVQVLILLVKQAPPLPIDFFLKKHRLPQLHLHHP